MREEKRREEKRREEKRREGNTTLLTNRLSFKLLILLLSLILLFSMSCSNEDKTGGSDNGDAGSEISNGGDSNSGKENGDSVKTKHELEGTWIGYDEKDKNYELKFKVDSDGNITFSPKPFLNKNDLLVPYSYTGKVETNAITYPYTAELNNRIISELFEPEGTFTFNNSSNCTAGYTIIQGVNANSAAIDYRVVNFTKQLL